MLVLLLQDELLLSECFSEGVRQARKAGPASASQALRVVNFDWHETTKRLKEKGCVEALWALLRPLLPAVGFSMGILKPTSSPATSPSPLFSSPEKSEAPVKVAEAAAASSSASPVASEDLPQDGQAAESAAETSAEAAKHPLGSDESDADEQPGMAEPEPAAEPQAAALPSTSTSGRYVAGWMQPQRC